MAVLSIQSRVACGYVGNAAAVPVLQRLGHTVWPIDTVNFSNHPAHGSYTGRITPASAVGDLVDGLETQGCFANCDALLTGYLGTAETGDILYESAGRIRQANAKTLWFCDPVMGDNGSFYVAEGIPEFFRDQALPAADIVLPNVFEATYLSGIAIDTMNAARKAAGILLSKGPKIVVITGVTVGRRIGALAATTEGIWQCVGPESRVAASGAGDVFSALFAGHFMLSHDTATALCHAVSGVHKVIEETVKANAQDLCLVRALPGLDDLSLFPAEKIG